MNRPTLTTERLVLRPLQPEDADDVQRYVSAYEVALNTATIPHPYPEGGAKAWIALNDKAFDEGKAVTLAVTLREDGAFIGAITLMLKDHDVAEAGYWIGVPHWSNGYASEAMGAMIRYAFEELKRNRVEGYHFIRNEASGRVMKKVGMVREGELRQAIKKWGEYLDIAVYAILRSEWDARGRVSS